MSHSYTSNRTDPLCGYCGRPIVGQMVTGATFYHPECVHGPSWNPAPELKDGEYLPCEKCGMRHLPPTCPEWVEKLKEGLKPK